MLSLLWMLCTVKKTLNQIVQKGNHYILKVKGNQKKLLSVIKETIQKSKPVDFHTEKEISRGRTEARKTFFVQAFGQFA